MKKILIAISAIILLFLATLAITSYIFLKERPFPVALISDIHMGSPGCQRSKCGDKAESALREVLDKTKGMLVISGGDNTDASEFSKDQVTASKIRDGYKKKLLEIVGDRKVLWTNGNHDRLTYVGGQEYFSYDENNWRFIVIHTTDVEDQLDWLEKQLKTDKNKVVIMHHPVFKQGTENIQPRYEILMKLFRENDVSYVLSGHWHADNWERIVDGVTYKAMLGLTFDYKTNYEILNLDYRLVDLPETHPLAKRFFSSIDYYYKAFSKKFIK